jgi:hypothetical protein
MAERLPDKLDAEVARLFNEAEALFDDDEYERAFARFRTAWELIPEPRDHWQRALQVLAAIADCQYYLCDFEDCFQTLQLMLRSEGGGPDNPWVCLRLGQCCLAQGREQEAGNWLVSALVLGGTEMFEDGSEGEGCRDFLVERLDPPPGGWPQGW